MASVKSLITGSIAGRLVRDGGVAVAVDYANAVSGSDSCSVTAYVVAILALNRCLPQWCDRGEMKLLAASGSPYVASAV